MQLPASITPDDGLIFCYNSLENALVPLLQTDSCRFAGNSNSIMKTTSIITLTAVSSFTLLLASCKSKQEQARESYLEQKAENLEAGAGQLRKDGEKVAEMKEEHAEAIRKSSEQAADATENDADATRKAVEKRADQIEDQADKVREAK